MSGIEVAIRISEMKPDKEESGTVGGLLEEIAQEICDGYCKYSDGWSEEKEEEMAEYCFNCPLNKLGI